MACARKKGEPNEEKFKNRKMKPERRQSGILNERYIDMSVRQVPYLRSGRNVEK